MPEPVSTTAPASRSSRKARLWRALLPALAVAASLGGCAALTALKDRLGALGVGFSLSRVDVSRLIYPDNALGIAAAVLRADRSLLGRIGVDVVCRIHAENANPARAAFDGAVARLRVADTSASAPSIAGTLSAFSLEPNAGASFDVTFPLRLDNPVLARSAWKAIIKGDDVPYRVDADLRFRLSGAEALGLPDSTRSLTLNVAKGSVDAKGGKGLAERVLAALDAAF